MGKIKESINTWVSAKKHGRTFEQQSYRDELARNLRKLRKEGDKERMNKLLDKEIMEHGDKYFGSIQTLHGRKPTNALAKKLIKEGGVEIVLENLEAFSGLDKEIGIKLACTNYDISVLPTWHNHHLGLDGFHRGIGLPEVIANIDKFPGLDVNVLINEYIKRFNEMSKIYSDKELIEGQKKVWLGSGIGCYKGSNINKETAKMLIHNGASICIIDNIDKFEGLDEEIANLLMEEGYGKFVKAHPEKFGLNKEK